MEREELAGWLRLAHAAGVGNRTARKLLSAFGLPEAIFRQSRMALEQVVSAAQADTLLSAAPELPSSIANTWEWLAGSSSSQPRHVLTLADARYPAALLQIADPPLILYVTGHLPVPWPAGIAMVGSRNPTAQGAANARQFAAAFARAGWTVVSGLAMGIDAAAHEGALEGAPDDGTVATIAVVGTGLDRVYPKQNLALTHRIADRGLVVSEYAIGTPPLAANFPKRNRIIAALGQGTVVVEAALQSGSLITAREAVDQGKEVFAIPGSIHSPQSRGCHALLKQGAKLVETAQDVLEELPSIQGRSPEVPTDVHEPEGDQDPLLTALGFDPVSLDALVARTGIPAPQLQARLLELELRDEVARLPGGMFQRLTLA